MAADHHGRRAAGGAASRACRRQPTPLLKNHLIVDTYDSAVKAEADRAQQKGRLATCFITFSRISSSPHCLSI
jgi:hypothetical protein